MELADNDQLIDNVVDRLNQQSHWLAVKMDYHIQDKTF